MSTQTIYTRLPILLTALVMISPTLAVSSARKPPSTAVRLRDLAKHYGATEPRAAGQEGVAITGSNGRTLLFMPNSRQLRVDGVLVWLNGPVTRSKRSWSLETADAMRTAAPLLSPTSFLPTAQHRLVLLDPGHGGTDTGALGTGNTCEKDLTLLLADGVRKTLLGHGINCELTRTTDSAISLSQRIELARRKNAGLFISIHFNSSENPASSGLETFLNSAAGFPSTAAGSNACAASPGNAHDAANLLLAHRIHSSILTRTRQTDRGVKRARFMVIRDAPCPAALVECGFLSNSQEEVASLSTERQAQLISGISSGIMAYLSDGEQPLSPK